MEDKGEKGEPFLEGAAKVGQGVDWQVLSDWGGWDRSLPLEEEVDRGESVYEGTGRALGPKA